MTPISQFRRRDRTVKARRGGIVEVLDELLERLFLSGGSMQQEHHVVEGHIIETCSYR